MVYKAASKDTNKLKIEAPNIEPVAASGHSNPTCHQNLTPKQTFHGRQSFRAMRATPPIETLALIIGANSSEGVLAIFIRVTISAADGNRSTQSCGAFVCCKSQVKPRKNRRTVADIFCEVQLASSANVVDTTDALVVLAISVRAITVFESFT